MFGIPGKAAVTLTPIAAKQIARLMDKQGSKGLRIGVKKGGCAGMEYTMDYVQDVNPLDEVVEQDGALQFRNYSVFITMNTLERIVTFFKSRDKVPSQFLLDSFIGMWGNMFF